MPGTTGTFEQVAALLAQVVSPISRRLSDEEVLGLLADLGVEFPAALVADPGFRTARASIAGAAAQLGPLTLELGTAEAAGDTGPVVAAGLALANQALNVITALDQLGPALTAAAAGLPGITPTQVADLVADLPKKVLDLLVAEVLELAPPIASILNVLGIVERTYDEGDLANPTKPEFEKVEVHLDRILRFLTDPLDHLATLYGWGGALDVERLFAALELAVARLGLPALVRPPAGPAPMVLEAFAVDVRPTTSGTPTGLDIDVVLPGSVDTTIEFPVSPPNWMATLGLKGNVHAGASATVRPPLDIRITHPTHRIEAEATARLQAEPAEPFVVLGQPGGSRLEFARMFAEAGLRFRWNGTEAVAEPTAEGRVTGGRLLIEVGDDGLLSTLLGGGRIDSTFDVGFSFATDTGLRFHGSGALEIQLPVHVSLGPLEIQALYLVVRLAGGNVPIELSAALKAQLGPLTAVLDRVGVIADIGLPPGGGNLGPVDLAFRFKPPDGVGLSLDVGVVKGGGFLGVEPDGSGYSGALELVFAEFLALKAIGVITTRMPDGKPGFSLIVIITAEFGSGIQLGYGFTLLGVGGLLGLNRTMQLQPLMEGVRTGAIESIMFPDDIVANAPRIISDLKRFFPPREGTFLIGPMLKLGWGTPTLISASVGVIIEIPGNIAIVGIIKVALPTEDLPILVLQVNFAGAIEFDKKRLYFFASLFESRVLFMTIEGEMGLLVAWGDDANFVLSVGGFHPQFNPPPLPFPSPKRIVVDIVNRPGARIRAQGYFAVTSNTAQFGASCELYFGFDAFSLQGHIGFDALFRFSPFAFVIEVSASVSLKAFGVGVFSIRLHFALEGPTPWRAHGTGSISLLFFELSADFDITWREARDTTLPPVDVMPLVAGEVERIENWQTKLPPGGNLLVALRELGAGEGLVLHPVGMLQIRQRAVPLDFELDKVGTQKPRDANRFGVSVSGTSLRKAADVDELFARAQFEDMDDAAKLGARAFDPLHGGIEVAVSDASLASARAVKRVVRHEVVTIDTAGTRRNRFVRELVGLFEHFLKGNSISRNPLSHAEKKLKQPFDAVITVPGEKFVVAFAADNTALSSQAAFASQAMAEQFLASQVRDDPSLATALHVIPTVEMQGAL